MNLKKKPKNKKKLFNNKITKNKFQKINQKNLSKILKLNNVS